jgi:acetate kinase
VGDLTPVPAGVALVVNAGSTSVKLAVVEGTDPEPVWATTVERAGERGGDRAVVDGLRSAPRLAEVSVVGHRVVHGGLRFDGPVLVDASVEAEIAALEALAPLHNRAALDGMAAARQVVAATVPQVAVFDTAFHRSLPLAAAAYGGPHAWLSEGLRRFGFHGISHRHAASTAAAILGRPLEDLRLVTCHLGGGCSLAAVAGGRSIDTTMGFTPLDGLVMATRSGSVDPGLLLHLLRAGTTVDDLEHVLEHESGLLGLSGVSADLRDVLRARADGDERAALAIDVFVHRIVTGVGAMVAALGGVDALVFTGGVGERSPEVRARVVAHLGFLGASVDDVRNAEDPADAAVSGPEATVAVLVVRAREELAIAHDALRLVHG